MRPVACLGAIMALGLAILLPSALAAADEANGVAPSGNNTSQVPPQPPKDIVDCNVLSEQGRDVRPLLISGLSVDRDQLDPSFLIVRASLSNDQDATYVVDTLCLSHSGSPAIFEGGPPLGFSGPEISDEYLVFVTQTVSLEPGDSVEVEFVLREDNWEPGTLVSLTWVGESDSVLAHLGLLVPRPIPSTEPTPTPTPTPTQEPTTPTPSPTMSETEPSESSSPSGQLSLGPCYPEWWYPTCPPTPTPTSEAPTEVVTEEPTLMPTQTPIVLPPISKTPTPTPSASPTISTSPPAPPTSVETSSAPVDTVINNPPVLVILPATSRPTAVPTSLETDVATPTPTPSYSSPLAPIPPSPLPPDPVDPPKTEHPIAAALGSPIATAIVIAGMATVACSGLFVIRRVGIPKV